MGKLQLIVTYSKYKIYNKYILYTVLLYFRAQEWSSKSHIGTSSISIVCPSPVLQEGPCASAFSHSSREPPMTGGIIDYSAYVRSKENIRQWEKGVALYHF